MEKNIIVTFCGGLGNQLFQFGFSQYLKKKYNLKVMLDISGYKNTENITPRNYELHNYPRVRDPIAGTASLLYSKLLVKSHRRLEYKESGFRFQEIDKINQYSRFTGFWQSYKYLDPVRSVLIDKIQLPKVSTKCADLIKRVVSSNSVCLHVRRGDYVTNKGANNFHGVLSKRYYLKAIDSFFNNEDSFSFFLFSDDVEWCRKEFSDLKKVTFVQTNSALEDLEVMRHCKHFVIANSTFSWWGAYLASFSDKIVVAPKQWFKDDRVNTEDLIPKEWYCL